MTDQLTIAACQMVTGIGSHETPAFDANMARITALVMAASDRGCGMAVLPENVLTFGQPGAYSQQIQAQWLDQFARLAESAGLWLVAGSLPLAEFTWQPGQTPTQVTWPAPDNMTGKPFATSVVFDDRGCIAGVYRKMHLFDAKINDATGAYRESDSFRPGSSPGLVATPWGIMGLGICYDLRFPEYFRQLRAANAAFVVLPSAFTWTTGQAHWELLLRARAVENQMFLVGVNQGGAHSATRKTWGDSMLVDAWGTVLARAGGAPADGQSQLGEQLVVARLNFAEQATLRDDMPVWLHRKL